MITIFRYSFYPVISIIFVAYWILKCDKVLKFGWATSFLIALLHEIACAISAVAMSFVEAGLQIENATTYRLYGLMFFMPIFYFALAKVLKREVNRLFDVFAFALMIRLIIGRVDCLISGCCQGVLMFGHESIRWPIRELEICYYLIMVFIFSRKVIRGKTFGQVYPQYLLTYGLFRFAIEWVREEYVGQIGIFHLAHVWSLLSILAGGISLYVINKQNSMKNNKRLNCVRNTENKRRGGSSNEYNS